MARLNEAPAATATSSAAAATAEVGPAESVDVSDYDEVKRRFVRQNRELAKNNSNQSLRIRSLEIEVSKLLSDNLALRERTLHVENELYEARSGPSNGSVVAIKTQLEAKLAELGSLVSGLGDQRHERRREQARPERTSPDQKQWRTRQTLAEVMADSRMPAISEDKLYPRRTLEGEEIQHIRLCDDSSQESPYLGPPPVAHFDYDDPVKFDFQPSQGTGTVVGEASALSKDDESLPAALSVNLETRRKRKEGQSRLEIRRSSILPPNKDSPIASSEVSLPSRTGAKRKLSVRDADEPGKFPGRGDFMFTRRSTLSAANSPGNAPAPGGQDERQTEAEIKDATKSAIITVEVRKSERHVLAEKSVNVSPRKRQPSAMVGNDGTKKPLPPPKDPSGDRVLNRKLRVSSMQPMRLEEEEVVKTIELPLEPQPVQSVLPPKTPAAPDVFSPTPSEPSARPAESRDTPPPGDLSNASITGEAGRPSRRARAAVNYAEPNLISKMRRPTKQLVGAVEGERVGRRSVSSLPPREDSVPPEDRAVRPVTIKKEAKDDRAWMSLPAMPLLLATTAALKSPLSEKSEAEQFRIREPVPIAPDDNDTSTKQQLRTAIEKTPSASSAAILALTAGKRKRRESSQLPISTDMEDVAKHMEELDVYDFKDCSPNISSDPLLKDDEAPKRPGRRHSSVPSNLMKDAHQAPVAMRRTSSLSRPKESSSVPKPSIGENMDAAGPGKSLVGRSERAASRRCSMML